MWIRHAFAQFSRYRVETLQVRQRFSGTDYGGVDDSTVPRGAQKWWVNHSKNVNSTCFPTVFKIHSWNFSITSKIKDSPGQVVKGSAILRYPVDLRNKGIITQKTWIRHALAQFSRYKVETLHLRQRLPGHVVDGLTILRHPVELRN